MKRFVALLLVCCLLVSSLCVTASAADDPILLKYWSCATAGKTITIPESSGSSGAFPTTYDIFGVEPAYPSSNWEPVVDSSCITWFDPYVSGTPYSCDIVVNGILYTLVRDYNSVYRLYKGNPEDSRMIFSAEPSSDMKRTRM